MTNEPKLPFTDQDMRDAEQYAFNFAAVPQPQPHPADHVIDDSCPHHVIFVYGCRYCDPR
jgi:hypothetical protein